MAKLGYSFRVENEEKIAKALGRALRISPKWSIEIARELRGMRLDRAMSYLEDIIAMRRPLPLKRFKKGVAHRRGLVKACAGRYPQKAARQVLKLLKSARANAEYKGLDPERLFIKHIAAQRGPVIRGWIPRAYGRATPHNTPTTHIEVILEER